MTVALSQQRIASDFLAACLAELDALKPGNVHRFAGGHHMGVEHFERAAQAAAPLIAEQGLGVGARILAATEASFAVTGVNTNLGIVLLAAPLAKATAETDVGTGLRRRLSIILSALDTADAENAFAAIRLANPAGLGEVKVGDVRTSNPPMTLTEAMYIAKDRDRIANAYVTAYSDIFDFALPAFEDALREASEPHLSVTTLHMTILSEFADSHIVRKFGAELGAEVRDAAAALRPAWSPVATPKSFDTLMEFDRQLKDRGLNPGTTADFVVNTLFTHRLMSRRGT